MLSLHLSFTLLFHSMKWNRCSLIITSLLTAFNSLCRSFMLRLSTFALYTYCSSAHHPGSSPLLRHLLTPGLNQQTAPPPRHLHLSSGQTALPPSIPVTATFINPLHLPGLVAQELSDLDRDPSDPLYNTNLALVITMKLGKCRSHRSEVIEFPAFRVLSRGFSFTVYSFILLVTFLFAIHRSVQQLITLHVLLPRESPLISLGLTGNGYTWITRTYTQLFELILEFAV